MTARSQERLTLAALLLAGALVFGIGITWGLPSRTVDRYLFGDHEVWTGRQIHDLAGDRPEEGSRGADVDATPIMRSAEPMLLNGTDQDRARILIRYRLYTAQPDEMITLMSLARMKPARRDFDPRLYQYGGFWIYSVGALLALAGKLGLTHLTSDLVYYLDHPEAFGHFYIVARAWSAGWGLVGIAAVYWLTRRITAPPAAPASPPNSKASGSSTPAGQSAAPDRTPAFAAACFIFLPVVINMTHEAKPHLPAAVIMLLAVIAAAKYVESGRTRHALTAGALCGLAFGTVLTALPVFVILVVMVLLRREDFRRRSLMLLIASVLVGAAVYLITNPYVAINWFTRRDVLLSNIRNSTAMYAVGGWLDGLRNTAYLLAEAASPVVAAVAVFLILALLSLRWDDLVASLSAVPRDPRAAAALLLAAPAVLSVLQFCALAAGKPGEYGRFLVYPATVLAVAAITAVCVARPRETRRWHIILLGAAVIFGGRYALAFYRDATAPGRISAADFLLQTPSATLNVSAEPAPYAMPPFNLFTHKLVLQPDRQKREIIGETNPLLIVASDHPKATVQELEGRWHLRWPDPLRSRLLGETVISWADKAILIVAPNPALHHPGEPAGSRRPPAGRTQRGEKDPHETHESSQSQRQQLVARFASPQTVWSQGGPAR